MSVYQGMEPPNDVHTQAERWYARLRGTNVTPQERQAFEQWRQAHGDHARAYADTEQLWSDIGDLESDAELQALRMQAREAVRNTPSSRRSRLLRFAAAASVVIAVTAVLTFPSGERHRTARGEQKALTLSDGSRLVLNTDSEVRVHLREDDREIVLVRGQALFDVARDARPFRVRVGDDTITDIGTRFDVRREREWTQVDVMEGEVVVTRDGGQATHLVPGQQLRMDRDAWHQQTADVEMLARWAEGRLVFHEAPLAQVVSEVNRYGPGQLVLADASLSALTVSGDFRIGEPDSLLRALQSAFPIRVEIRGDDTRLYRRD